jgi:hypothetical protein
VELDLQPPVRRADSIDAASTLLLDLQLLPERDGGQEPLDELPAALLPGDDHLLLVLGRRRRQHLRRAVEPQHVGPVAALVQPLAERVDDVVAVALYLEHEEVVVPAHDVYVRAPRLALAAAAADLAPDVVERHGPGQRREALRLEEADEGLVVLHGDGPRPGGEDGLQVEVPVRELRHVGLVVAELPPLRRAVPDERVQLRPRGHRRVVGVERRGEHRHERRARALPAGAVVALVDGREEHRRPELRLRVPARELARLPAAGRIVVLQRFVIVTRSALPSKANASLIRNVLFHRVSEEAHHALHRQFLGERLGAPLVEVPAPPHPWQEPALRR